ncbi:hypothetical protein PAAG_00776 [Paracoccidioides lutzii Pb01]|uniref:Uncharacterized protein n=1 Tax=Paracoccidioides lutzii (strain ATCC MYA-826 / Pb01) TaxID=502779 RepID=C1GQI1_PARBA|nr:hypothetical protein PAAG_00776 [Paracoccidioides lutzii Pb01]EEH37855.2 hypothetical protein PAAG_00776 [Paracoccidioides lutzii Pb01]
MFAFAIVKTRTHFTVKQESRVGQQTTQARDKCRSLMRRHPPMAVGKPHVSPGKHCLEVHYWPAWLQQQRLLEAESQLDRAVKEWKSYTSEQRHN